MSGSHGDLFSEVGKMVLAANSGEAIDLATASRDLAERYEHLGFSEEMIAKAISRSIGAIGLAKARISTNGVLMSAREAIRARAVANVEAEKKSTAAMAAQLAPQRAVAVAAQAQPKARPVTKAKAAQGASADGAAPTAMKQTPAKQTAAAKANSKSLFPSGVRLAVLS